ncbi:MAG: AMP-binding protein, partial [Rhodospirillaceae bacterium]|nr:AMP-binding protein [Rhodospirillaceae bacterium]
ILAEIYGAEDTTSSVPLSTAGLPNRTREHAGAAPDELGTLNAILRWHAEIQPDRIHVHFYADQAATDTPEAITYGQLYDQAKKIAAGLIERQLSPGESVLLMLPTGREYLVSFFGVLLAGGVPVPIYPPGRPQQLEEHILRHAKIADTALAGLMITVAEAKLFSHLLSAQVPSLRAVVTCDDLLSAAPLTRFPEPAENDTAFLQFTSGSTGDPKGVILSHHNLVSNIRVMGKALKATPEDVFVSWLPLYHDMGLIGAWLGSLTHGVPLVIMSPLSFLARPERWLQAIHRYGGTISGAPNFAYEACINRIRDEDIEGLDLSSWRVAFNGAEAVSPKTIVKFSERFANFGLSSQAMNPVYGLAENAVGLAFPPLGREPRIDRIDRKKYMNTGLAEPIEGIEESMQVPSCGRALAGHQIRIVNQTGQELPERHEGRVQFQGPSASAGYFRNPEATKDLLAGEWRNAGDLGYMADGEVFITGRQKDLIIRAGRNIYPAELEEMIGEIDGVQKGNIAVFGSPDPETGTERLIVLAEARRRSDEAQIKIKSAINALALDLVGTPPDQIELVPPRSVPKTSSGKIRRQAARALFESGLQENASRASLKWQIIRLCLAAIGPTLRRGLRSAAAWVYVYYMYVLFALIALASWFILAILPGKTLRFGFLRIMLSILMGLGGIRISVAGLANIPKDQRIIFASNHTSYFDGAALLSALPGVPSFVAKSELAGNFISRLFLARLGTKFVKRFQANAAQEIDEVAETIRQGQSVVYFPEGTFTGMAGLLPFQMGAFTTALATDAAIVPVALSGVRSILRENTGFPRPGKIHVEILPAILPDPALADQSWQAALDLRNRVRNAVLEHCGEPDLAHEHINPLHLKEDAQNA